MHSTLGHHTLINNSLSHHTKNKIRHKSESKGRKKPYFLLWKTHVIPKLL